MRGLAAMVRDAFLGGLIVLLCLLCLFWDAMLGRKSVFWDGATKRDYEE
jgi:hypothetical protein